MGTIVKGGKSFLRKLVQGSFQETFDALVTSDGSTITMSIEQSGGGDLTMQFSDGDTMLDCTPACTIALTAGSDSSPQPNYIYIPQSTKVLTKSTTTFPTSTEHIKVGYFLVGSEAYVQADGAYINQNWNDHLAGTDSQGHLLHIAERSRRDTAYYFSGIDPAGTDDSANASYFDYVGGTEAYFKSSAGVVYQMHRHVYGAKDTRVGSNDIHVVNERATGSGGNGAYWAIHDITDIDEDATGGTLTNRFFNFTFWGVANKSGEYAPIMCNLPTGSYANQSNAEGDVDSYDVLTMPRAFNLDSSTGFLICRMTFKNTSGNWSHKSTVDLRGQTPTTATGGVAGITTSFADNQFTVFDEADSTKIMAFDVGTNAPTATTRTFIVPGADDTIAGIGSNQSFSGVNSFAIVDTPFISGVSVISGAESSPYKIQTQGLTPNYIEVRGTDCTGNHGEVNRTLDLSGVATNEIIYVQGAYTHSPDYSKSEVSNNTRLTFNNKIYNTFYIAVYYWM